METEENKYDQQTKFIRQMLQNNSDGSKSTRKNISPAKVNHHARFKSSKNYKDHKNRQLNAVNDISPPKNGYGYSFVYDENMPTPKKTYGHERKVLQHISKNKPKINPPSPDK